MKELKQTRRIFIAGLLFAAIIIIGVLTMSKPSLSYEMSSKEALLLIGDDSKMISVSEAVSNDYQWVDIRNQFDFANGHVAQAHNIYAPDLFEPFSILYLKKVKADGKKILIYGKDIYEASDSWMILSQLGFDNVFYLKEGFDGYELFKSKKWIFIYYWRIAGNEYWS